MIPDRDTILNKHAVGKDVFIGSMNTRLFRYDDAKKAMDEYAKEIAIGYDKWKIENGWEWSAARNLREEKNIWFIPAGDGRYLTHEELLEEYITYIQSLNKQP